VVVRFEGEMIATYSRLAKVSVLILDVLGLAALTDPERRDLLEVIEDRHGTAATIITSQLPVENRHEMIGNPPLPMPSWTGWPTTPTG
jgi:DNA replication protein DnaC